MAHQSAQSPDDASASFLNGIVIALLLTAGALAAWLVVSAPEIPAIDEGSFENLTSIDMQRLEAERERAYGSIDLATAQEPVDHLRQTVRAVNLVQFESVEEYDKRQAATAAVFAANDVLTPLGEPGFMKAGNEMAKKCVEGVDEVRAALKAGDLTPEQAVVDPGTGFPTFRENCGPLMGQLLKWKVVQPSGDWTDPDVGPALVEIFSRYRWAAILDLRRPAFEMLTPYEHEVLTRFRADLEALPVQKRLEWVMQLAASQPVVATELQGNLALESGDVPAAAQLYAQVCDKNSKDRLLRAKCDWLNEQVVAPAGAASAAAH